MFESQTHHQNAHIDRYSTRYGQAPVVALAWDWPGEDEPIIADAPQVFYYHSILKNADLILSNIKLYRESMSKDKNSIKFKFSLAWSCVSLPRATTSIGWKLLIFV